MPPNTNKNILDKTKAKKLLEYAAADKTLSGWKEQRRRQPLEIHLQFGMTSESRQHKNSNFEISDSSTFLFNFGFLGRRRLGSCKKHRFRVTSGYQDNRWDGDGSGNYVSTWHKGSRDPLCSNNSWLWPLSWSFVELHWSWNLPIQCVNRLKNMVARLMLTAITKTNSWRCWHHSCKYTINDIICWPLCILQAIHPIIYTAPFVKRSVIVVVIIIVVFVKDWWEQFSSN